MIYRNNLKKYVQISVSVALLLGISKGGFAYTLHDAIISAHENNYSIRAQAESLKSTEMNLNQAYAGFLPQVTAQGQVAKTKFKRDNNFNTNPNSKTYSLQVAQPLYNGGGTIAAVKNAEHTIKAAEWQYKAASNQLSIDVTNSYTGLFYALNFYELTKHKEKVFSDTLAFVRAMFEAGQVTITDVLTAEANLAEAVAGKEDANGKVQIQEATFERLVGYKAPPPETMEDIKIDNITLPSGLEELLELCLANNPSYLYYKSLYEVAKYNVDGAIAKALPTLSANASINRSDNPKSIFRNNNPDSSTYALQLSVPIFQGGSDYASIKQQKYLLQKADYDQQEIERKVKEFAIQAWSSYKTAVAVIKSSTENVSAAGKAFEATKEEYRIGTKTILDLSNAEQKLFDAEVALIKAGSDKINAIYGILQNMGAIDAVELGAL